MSFTIEEVDGSTVSAGGSVSILGYGSINLGGEIAREYGVTYGQTGTVSDSTTVEVPAGESILYTVEVREKYGTGTFVVEAAGRSDEFPYEILLGIDTTARGESQGCSFLGGLQGTYTLREWRERRPPEDSPVVLGMGVRRGTLTIDEFGHAVWDLDLDSGMEEQFTPGLRCLGIVDETAESLGGITGELEVAGETLKGDQRDWNRNLLSLQADALVAWCGHTFFLQDELFVYDRRMDDYSLSLRVIDANTFVLTMQNVAGTFTWEKD